MKHRRNRETAVTVEKTPQAWLDWAKGDIIRQHGEFVELEALAKKVGGDEQ